MNCKSSVNEWPFVCFSVLSEMAFVNEMIDKALSAFLIFKAREFNAVPCLLFTLHALRSNRMYKPENRLEMKLFF